MIDWWEMQSSHLTTVELFKTVGPIDSQVQNSKGKNAPSSKGTDREIISGTVYGVYDTKDPRLNVGRIKIARVESSDPRIQDGNRPIENIMKRPAQKYIRDEND